MKTEEITTLEPNKLVLKYKDDLFRRNEVDYSSFLDKETLKEHRRQISRLQ